MNNNMKLLLEYKTSKNKNILDEIVCENQKLILYVLKKYFFKEESSAKYDREDLFQQGNLGLLKCIEKYDVNKGEFSTLATSYIRGYIKKFLSFNKYDLSLSSYGFDKISNSLKEKDKDKTDITIKTVVTVPIYLDSTINNKDGDTTSICETIENPNNHSFDEIEFEMVWEKIAIKILSEKEKEIIECLVYRNEREDEVAKKLNMTTRGIYTAKKRALEKLRNNKELRKVFNVQSA